MDTQLLYEMASVEYETKGRIPKWINKVCGKHHCL